MPEINDSDTKQDLRERAARVLHSLLRFLKSQSTTILWMIVILLVILLFPTVLSPIARKKIVLLTGPDGGLYRRMGATIEDDFKRYSPWKFWGRSFDVVAKGTEGSEENRLGVDQDRDGTHLGFTQDGFSPTPNVRSVLHLYDAPLHIVVRKQFYNDVVSNKWPLPDKPNWSFSDVTDNLKPKRVYLGLAKSGTRQVANLILKQYNVSSAKVDCGRDYDLKEAGYALEDGTIDLAFLSVQVGAKVLEDIARSDNNYLLRLDDATGIKAANPFLKTWTIPAHTYNSATKFPEIDTETVATRQVLICPTSMSDTDVYWLARSVDTCLRNSLPDVPWADDLPPPKERSDFKYTLHDGAKALRDEKPPRFVSAIKYVLFAVLLPAFATLIQRLPAFLMWLLHVPAESKDEQKADAYVRLNAELETILSELEHLVPPVTKEALESFTARANALEQKIKVGLDKQTLAQPQFESLMRGMKNTRFELREVGSQVVPKPSPVTARTGSPTSPVADRATQHRSPKQTKDSPSKQ